MTAVAGSGQGGVAGAPDNSGRGLCPRNPNPGEASEGVSRDPLRRKQAAAEAKSESEPMIAGATSGT